MATHTELLRAAGTRAAGHLGSEETTDDNVLDFSLLDSGAGSAQNDLTNMIRIPADVLVRGVHVKSLSLSTLLDDMDIGDDDDPDGWIATVDLTAAVNTWAGQGIGAAAYAAATGGVKYYSAAKILSVTTITAATIVTGIFVVRLNYLALHRITRAYTVA